MNYPKYIIELNLVKTGGGACIDSKIAKICGVHAGVPSYGAPFFCEGGANKKTHFKSYVLASPVQLPTTAMAYITAAHSIALMEDQFIRWALLSDDCGCFSANAVKIKGDVYPNREICDMKSTFNQCASVQNFSAIRCPANLWPFSFQCPNPIP